MKDLWTLSAQHHYFFNRVPTKQPKFSFVRIGSRFRYSGRTFRQTQRDFSERKFDPIDPDVRVRMSQRKKRQSSHNDETEDSAYPGYVKARESFRKEKVENNPNGEVADKPDSNEIVVDNNPVEVPEPGTEEALLQKDVTDKFLHDEFEQVASKQTDGDELPRHPLQKPRRSLRTEIWRTSLLPQRGSGREGMVSGDTKVVESAEEPTVTTEH